MDQIRLWKLRAENGTEQEENRNGREFDKKKKKQTKFIDGNRN